MNKQKLESPWKVIERRDAEYQAAKRREHKAKIDARRQAQARDRFENGCRVRAVRARKAQELGRAGPTYHARFKTELVENVGGYPLHAYFAATHQIECVWE